MNLDILRKRLLGKVYHKLSFNKLDKLPLKDSKLSMKISKLEMITLMIQIIGLKTKKMVYLSNMAVQRNSLLMNIVKNMIQMIKSINLNILNEILFYFFYCFILLLTNPKMKTI